jgi:hypothetical protein
MRFDETRIEYTRDPALLWGALVSFFALLIVILGLTLGHAIAERRAAMLSFVNSYETYQFANIRDQSARPVRVILAQ